MRQALLFFVVLALVCPAFAQQQQPVSIEQLKAAYSQLKDDNVQIAARNNQAYTDLVRVIDMNLALQTRVKELEQQIADKKLNAVAPKDTARLRELNEKITSIETKKKTLETSIAAANKSDATAFRNLNVDLAKARADSAQAQKALNELYKGK